MATGQGRPSPPLVALVGAALAGASGSALAPWLMPWPLLLGALGAAALGCFLARSPGARGLATLTLALLVGALLLRLAAGAVLESRLPTAFDGAEARIEGRLVGLPRYDAEGLVALFAVEQLRSGPAGLADQLEGRRVELRWFRDGAALAAGSRWQLGVGLRPPPPSPGPGQADAARRSAVEGWVAVAQVRGSAPVLALGPAAGPRAALDRWRAARAAAIEAALGAADARYVRALAIGDTRGLDSADWSLLRRFGLTHLIAISGFHVALVALLGVAAVRMGWWCWPALARRWPRPLAAAWGGLLVALAYAGMAGFSLPTVRTVLMIAVVALARSALRHWPPLQPLALAVAAVLLVDPLAVLTPGFWLSCGGVLLLVWGCGEARLPLVRGFLRAQWVASFGLLPVLAAAFLAVPVLGPLANLVAIPWISLVVVPLAVLGLLFEALAPALAGLAWGTAAAAMGLLERGLWALPDSLAPLWWTGPPSLPALALAVLGIGWMLLPRGVPARPAGLLLLLPLLWPTPPQPVPGSLELHVFDLPRGQAVLVRSAHHALLVDAGPPGDALVEALHASGLRRLDRIVLTRDQPGRRGGLAAVQAAWPQALPWLPPGAVDGTPAEAGTHWAGLDLGVEVLHPHADFPTGDAEATAVLRLHGAFGEVLLAGDGGRWIAARIAAQGHDPRLLLAGPAVLAEWQARFPAAQAVASRRPGPALSRRWPERLAQPGRGGRLHIVVPADGPPRIAAWRGAPRRWWDGAAIASGYAVGP